MSTPPRLTEQTQRGEKIGPQLKTADILGKEVLVTEFSLFTGMNDAPCAVMQAYMAKEVEPDGVLSPDRAFWFVCGAANLMQKLADPAVKAPFIMTLDRKKSSAGRWVYVVK